MSKMTFVSTETWRGSEVGGAGSLTHRETVHASGLVEYEVKGWTEDDGTVLQRGTREADASLSRPLDLERVKATRLSSGWRLAS